MTAFNAPSLRKAIKVAQDMGLAVAGYEITPDGGFRVMTASDHTNPADAAVEAWKRGQRGKD